LTYRVCVKKGEGPTQPREESFLKENKTSGKKAGRPQSGEVTTLPIIESQ